MSPKGLAPFGRRNPFCVLQKAKKGLEFNSLARRLHLFASLVHPRLSESHSRKNHERTYFY